MIPILFNTQMVKEIIAGNKTQTRRLIKPQPAYVMTKEEVKTRALSGADPYGFRVGKLDTEVIGVCKYQKDDILYVRETWAYSSEIAIKGHPYMYRADNAFMDENLWHPKWKPSIHMPKEAARIFLKVTNVRVEQLQDITNTDACLEGAVTDEYLQMEDEASICGISCQPIREYFGETIWNSTIKPQDRDIYGWDANPYVYVIEFEQCDPPHLSERKVK